MEKIAWITDSTCYIDPTFQKNNQIFIVPMNISFENETFKDGIDISEETFYQKLTSSPSLPKSSQPSIGELVELYENLKSQFDLGIAVHVSSELSGTVHTARQAAEIADFPLFIVDSKLISLPMFYMIRKAQNMVRDGIPISDVVRKLENMYRSNQLYVMVGSLEQLHKGGRVSTIQMVMGSLLKIKPILTFRDGKIIPCEKVRTNPKALLSMVSKLQNDIENGHRVETVFILSGKASAESEIVKEQIRSLFSEIEIITGPLGSAIGVHAGEGTIGISWFRES
ncbi:DegV family protein [Niallia sp. Krafla_26]|uniref:DegV family protein n=1 Tax=Niallia sp. Krafla_26 TaxID=3064703 RepID=UPI003D17BEFB